MAEFVDRSGAGRRLAGTLDAWRGMDAVVLGIPRGGVVVAAEVARELGLRLGVVVVRKLGAPSREEFAVGAIADGVRIVDVGAQRHAGVRDDELAAVERRERTELERRAELFASDVEVRGRTVIVVDDGIATGSTALAACRALRAQGAATIVLATPVAPATWQPGPDVDEYVCLVAPTRFWAVGEFYDDFTQTSDDEVVRLLRESATR